MARSSYNPSLLLPIIDVIVGLTLLIGAGYIWYNTRGQEQIIEAQEQLDMTRRQQTDEIKTINQMIAEREDELVNIRNEQLAKTQYVQFLQERIEMETTQISEGREKDRRYTDELLELRDDIRIARDELKGNLAGVAEEDGRVRRRTSELDSLKVESLVRQQRVSALENEIAEARAVRRHDPWSIFPIQTGFLAAYEYGDKDQRFIAGLSQDLMDIQNLKLGIQGVLGLSSSENRSLKEGGLYLNVPLIFRRASLEFGAGIQGTTEGAGDTNVDPYASANFRLAPIRSERFFLLGGPYYTGSNTAIRLGLGFGRR
ncbi:MAG: hypothetical protein KJ970_19045 [Candidatus Eisenbacteria bacterium]|uniref:Uncharacterized protein n=1 Tax=Eiseniibacteriota bacterium TaxID=2212470 RepID=A0A948S0H0_UNCEI|nr:hypothetical protein [Candidatus Eisenbacteria bacterium]MBU1947255.1 hypothetical protein [Candidatus Eisenbacteria bacterium]MBU2693017.1 hypothetical protein [Candidatus Eisenbacteria bacterium]